MYIFINKGRIYKGQSSKESKLFMLLDKDEEKGYKQFIRIFSSSETEGYCQLNP